MDKKNSDKKNFDKTTSIGNSLKEASHSLVVLKKELNAETRRLPADARHMEKRIQELQQELDSISGGILAYKLRRLAESKMLESVSELAKGTLPEKKLKNTETQESKKPKIQQSKSNQKSRTEKEKTYLSSTFQCKSDLDQCLAGSGNALDKALCYALFIRCAVKG